MKSEYGPESLIFVEGDPNPNTLTNIVVERSDGMRLTRIARGVLAGMNLMDYAENQVDETVIQVQEGEVLGEVADLVYRVS